MIIEKNWFDIIDKPHEMLSKHKKNADMGEAIKTIALLGALVGLAVAIGILIGGSILGSLFPVIAQFGMAGLVVFPIFGIIFITISTLIINAVTWIFARLLGGNASYTEQIYIASRLAWPLFGVNTIIQILGWIPLMGAISILLSVLWSFYTIVLFTEMMAATHNLSSFRAYLTFGIPLAIVFGIFILLITAIAGLYAPTPGELGAFN